MQKLNKEKVNQFEILRLINEKMNNEYIEFLSSNSTGMKMVDFNICFIIQEGSVLGNVYFVETGKLTKKRKIT